MLSWKEGKRKVRNEESKAEKNQCKEKGKSYKENCQEEIKMEWKLEQNGMKKKNQK